jgi:TolA-binding protein
MKTRISLFILIPCILHSAAVDLSAQETKENAEFKLAVNLYNSRMYDLAADQFQNFIRAYPGTANSVEARFYLGLTQLHLKRYDEARVTFQQFALTYTDNTKAPDAWMHVGDAYVSLGNAREAASAYERVKVFYPNHPLATEGLLKAAIYYKDTGALDNARKAYRTVVQDYPTSKNVPAARLGLGELHMADGRGDLAYGEFSRAMETATDPVVKTRAMLLLGKLLLQNDQTDEADTLFSRIVSTSTRTPSHAAASLERGVLARQAERYDAAIDHLIKASSDTLAEDGINEIATIELAETYVRKNDVANALKWFDRFLTRFPASPAISSVYLRAGQMSDRLGNHRAAVGFYGKILSTKDNDLYKRKALVASAESALKLKEYARAAEFFSSFVEQYPADPYAAEVLFRLADLYENQLKDLRRAIAHYEAIALKYPRSPYVDDALFGAGRSRESLNDIDEALSTYLELLDRYPSSTLAHPARNRIDFLRNHKVKDRDAGIENLALLMGDMIIGMSKDQLAMKLGEIYFHDLKDYRSAAKQFENAIAAGVEDEELPNAHFYRARSFHLMSDQDNEAVGQAIAFYDSFLKRFPSTKWSDDAAFYYVQLKSKGKSDDTIALLLEEQLARRPTSLHRPELLIMLGTAHQNAGKVREAVVTFATVAGAFTNAPVAEQAWLRLGQLYDRMGMHDSAAFAYATLVSRFPRSSHTAEALRHLADLYMIQNRPAEAATVLERLKSDFYYSATASDADSALAAAYLEAGNYKQAAEILTSSWSLEQASPYDRPLRFSLLFALGKAEQGLGDMQQARELFREYLQYDTKSTRAADAYFALGSIARDHGNAQSATSYFRKAAVIGASEQSSREIAELLFHAGQYADAERQFNQLAKNAKSDDDKRYYLSRIIVCKLRSNDLTRATPLLTEFAKTYKKSDEALAELEYEKGLYHYRNQDYENAKKTFQRITDDFEKTRFGVWAEFYSAKVLEVTNKEAEATKKYEAILKRYPDSPVTQRVHLSLGNVNYNAERYQEAISFYQRILDSPDSTGEILHYAMDNIIDAYSAVRLYDAALKVTRDFIERFPDDPALMDKRISIGVLYVRLGYYDQAVVHLQKLLDEAGSDLEAEIRYAIGEAYYYKGDHQQAILEFLKVPYLVTKPGRIDWTATSFYMAGQAYEKMSRFDQAIAMYQQIIDRPGIDATFKAGAKKEIDRVKSITGKGSTK